MLLARTASGGGCKVVQARPESSSAQYLDQVRAAHRQASGIRRRMPTQCVRSKELATYHAELGFLSGSYPNSSLRGNSRRNQAQRLDVESCTGEGLRIACNIFAVLETLLAV